MTPPSIIIFRGSEKKNKKKKTFAPAMNSRELHAHGVGKPFSKAPLNFCLLNLY